MLECTYFYATDLFGVHKNLLCQTSRFQLYTVLVLLTVFRRGACGWVVGPEGLLQAWSGLGTRDQGACTSTVQVRLQVQYCTRSPARQSPVRFCAVQVRSTVPVQVQVQYVIIMRKRTVYLYKLCATALVTGQ